MPEVEELLLKSENTLEDAKKAFEEDMLVSTVQNRIYYAVFYAAEAALVSKNEDPKSHQGVKVRLGQVFVKKGELDKKWGEILFPAANLP